MASAKQRVKDLMRGYDIEDWDSDSIAEKIAASSAMRKVLTRNQRRLLVLGLFDGPTGEGEEDAAMKILKAAPDSDLKWVIGKIGWKKLERELDREDITYLRGRTGSLTDFDYTASDSDDIAEGIARRPSWLANFNDTEKLTLVRSLFDGPTGESQEDAAMKILTSMTDPALKRAVKTLRWSVLEDELDDEDLAVLLKRTLDFSAFDPESSRTDDIAVLLSRDRGFLAKLTRTNRKQLVRALFDGHTTESQEDAAARVLLSEPTGTGMLQLCREVGGWARLINELDGDHLDQITEKIVARLDDEAAALRAEMPWLYDPSLPLYAMKQKARPSVEGIVKAFQRKQAKALLATALERWRPIVDQIASRLLRKQPFPVERLIQTLTWLGEKAPGVKDVTQLRGEIHDTALVARNLEEGDYSYLARLLPDILDPSRSLAERLARFETFLRLEPELAAAAEAIEFFGSASQRAALARFTNAKDAFLAIDPHQPTAATIPAVIAALGGRASERFDDLTELIGSLAHDLMSRWSLPALLGIDDDNAVRAFVGKVASEHRGGISLLGKLPTAAKHKVVNACLDGATWDEDEDTILAVLRDSKARSKAELFQLVRHARLTRLDANLDGDQHDSLLALLR